jgi:hypothetical protein
MTKSHRAYRTRLKPLGYEALAGKPSLSGYLKRLMLWYSLCPRPLTGRNGLLPSS